MRTQKEILNVGATLKKTKYLVLISFIYKVYYISSSQVLFACNSKGKMTYIVLRVKSMYPYDGFLMSLPPCLDGVRFNDNNSYKKLGLGPP